MTAQGWRKGQIAVMMAGHRTGKSMFTTMRTAPRIQILDRADVDGAIWYTVQCKPGTVSDWVQEQDPDLWQRTDGSIDRRWYVHFNVFDMHEKLYTMLMLKWNQ